MFARCFPLALLLAGPALAQQGELLPAGGVADPPPPQVRIQVRALAAVAPDKPIRYKLIVTNPSTERAYKVKVRNPIPAGVTPGKAEPTPTSTPGSAELVWEVGELIGGGQKVIEFELMPKAGTTDVKNQAFVTSEYGQAVLTKVEKPKLKVEKQIGKSAALGEPVPVTVRVTNTGAVAVLDVELLETVTPGFRFDDGGQGKKGSSPEQRIWELGTLAPGQSRAVQYSVKGGQAGRLVTTSGAKGHGVAAEVPPETVTEVLATGLAVELVGTPTVPGGQRGKYTVAATNTGGLPLNDVKVTASLPPGVTLKKKTNGGQQYRDTVEWTLPRLDAGEKYEVRFELDSTTSGRKTVRAGARSARGIEAAARETATVFEGTSLLSLRAEAEPALPAAGQNGLLTLTVSNGGGEAARNVRLRVELPDGVTVEQTTPRDVQATKSEVVFPVATVAPGDPQKFTLTYKAAKAGTIFFRTTLDATGLTAPLTKEQSVEVVPR